YFKPACALFWCKSCASGRCAQHHPGPTSFYYRLASLIHSAMLENHDSPLRARLALPNLNNFGFRRDGIADEDRLGKLCLVKAEIADGGAQRQLADGESDHQPEREDAVDQALPKFGVFGKFRIQMERLRIHRQRREKQIIGFGHGAARLMAKDIANAKFLEVF